jgi:hypothetical protein
MEVTMIVLKKKLRATKCSDNGTISLMAHIAKMFASIFNERLKRKLRI